MAAKSVLASHLVVANVVGFAVNFWEVPRLAGASRGIYSALSPVVKEFRGAYLQGRDHLADLHEAQCEREAVGRYIKENLIY